MQQISTTIYYNKKDGYIITSDTTIKNTLLHTVVYPVKTIGTECTVEELGQAILQGLYISEKAEPVEPSPTSNVNTPGNGIGPASYSPTHALYIVGMNSTVSRHQSYTGNDSFIKSNDGVKMSTVENGIITGGLAYHMLAT